MGLIRLWARLSPAVRRETEHVVPLRLWPRGTIESSGSRSGGTCDVHRVALAPVEERRLGRFGRLRSYAVVLVYDRLKLRLYGFVIPSILQCSLCGHQVSRLVTASFWLVIYDDCHRTWQSNFLLLEGLHFRSCCLLLCRCLQLCFDLLLQLA